MKQPLITDLDQIKKLAVQRHDYFEVMRYMLEADNDLDDAKLDAQVDATAAPIIAAIDCTHCANCCRSLDVYLTEPDAQRLAEGIHIPVEDLLPRYIAPDAAVEEWGNVRARPCGVLTGDRGSVDAH